MTPTLHILRSFNYFADLWQHNLAVSRVPDANGIRDNLPGDKPFLTQTGQGFRTLVRDMCLTGGFLIRVAQQASISERFQPL